MQAQKNTLIFLNRFAFFIHGSSFIAALVVSIIYAKNSFLGIIEGLPPYPLIWVDLPFPIITAFFHGAIGFIPYVQQKYLYYIFKEHRNPIRWFEYSITASLMTWVILQLSGVTNIYLLILAGIICNIVLQAQGHLQEKLPKSWIPTLIGWIIFATQWTIIFTTFTNRQWFVYSILIGMFIFFCFFGFVQLSRVSAYRQDLLYLTLSLTAKLYLTWNLLIAAAIL
jgi:hypothetical protein